MKINLKLKQKYNSTAIACVCKEIALVTDSVNAAFTALRQLAQQRAEELEIFEDRNLQDSSDDEKSIDNPLYESFLTSIGSNGIIK